MGAGANKEEFAQQIGDVSTRDLRLASDAQLVVTIGRFRHEALG
jgi:hypothetical protein